MTATRLRDGDDLINDYGTKNESVKKMQAAEQSTTQATVKPTIFHTQRESSGCGLTIACTDAVAVAGSFTEALFGEQ